ncbi:hypothetical protein EVG20_g1101 [Dentipellis fragilis]|uniref:Xylanolytic transcriptional activator regulatory domain-containing protein n=1 Tax=Dentipellis fragilis TaxID=205917 RepID=A0A4Y9ZD25_9AGAM|nr:hypothetical protein EVG20_g1101 [Dentipellis fragilis]
MNSNLTASTSSSPSTFARTRLWSEDNPDGHDEATHSHEDDGPHRKRTKRGRGPLSCKEYPESHMMHERGEGNICEWDERPPEISSQPFALASDLDAALQRISKLESLIQSIQQDAAPNNPHDKLSPVHRTMGVSSEMNSRSPIHGSRNTSAPANDIDSETEEAAVALEEFAMGTRSLPQSRQRGHIERFIPQPRNQLHSGSSVSSPSDYPTILVPSDTGSRGMWVLASRYEVNWLQPRTQVEAALRALPSRQICDYLFSLYFNNLEWLWRTHHRPSFAREYRTFWDLYIQGRAAEVDPSWLALLFATFACAVTGIPDDRPPVFDSYSENDIILLARSLYEAAQVTLRASEPSFSPSFRALQAIILFAAYLQFYGMSFNEGKSDQAQMFIWLAIGIRMAMSMGYHRLGDNPHIMPPDDPAFPKGPSSLKREMAKRIWSTLHFLDGKASSAGVPSMIDNKGCTTGPPLNVNDDALGIEIDIQPLPMAQATDISLELARCQFVLAGHDIFEALHERKPITYEAVLELDPTYWAIYDSCATLLRPDYVAPPNEPQHWKWSRALLSSGTHNRDTRVVAYASLQLLRLHRPFMSRGYTNAKLSPSTRACIASARAILRTQSAVIDYLPSRFWPLNLHSIGAIVVLFIDIFHHIRHPNSSPGSSSDVDSNNNSSIGYAAEYAADIANTLAIFKKSESARAPPVRAIARQGQRVVHSLLEAETRLRGAGSGAGGFRDIAKEISSSERGSTWAGLTQGSSVPLPAGDTDTGTDMMPPPAAPAPLPTPSTTPASVSASTSPWLADTHAMDMDASSTYLSPEEVDRLIQRTVTGTGTGAGAGAGTGSATPPNWLAGLGLEFELRDLGLGADGRRWDGEGAAGMGEVTGWLGENAGGWDGTGNVAGNSNEDTGSRGFDVGADWASGMLW